MSARAGSKGEAAGWHNGPWAGQLPAWRDLDGTSATAGKDGAAQNKTDVQRLYRDLQSSAHSQQGGTAPVVLHHDNSPSLLKRTLEGTERKSHRVNAKGVPAQRRLFLSVCYESPLKGST